MSVLFSRQLYVTQSGRIVGIITRHCLSNFIGDREKRPMDTLYELMDFVKDSCKCGSNSDCGNITSGGSRWDWNVFGNSRFVIYSQ